MRAIVWSLRCTCTWCEFFWLLHWSHAECSPLYPFCFDEERIQRHTLYSPLYIAFTFLVWRESTCRRSGEFHIRAQQLRKPRCLRVCPNRFQPDPRIRQPQRWRRAQGLVLETVSERWWLFPLELLLTESVSSWHLLSWKISPFSLL